MEKFFTSEESARKFDSGEHNKNMERHQNNKNNKNMEDHHRFKESESVSNNNRFDQSTSTELHDEHQNLMDKNSYRTDGDNQDLSEPFKNGRYVPLFAPY